MKTFPSSISASNQKNFFELFRKRVECYLRRDIFEFLLSRPNDESYFAIDTFLNKFEFVSDLKKDFSVFLQNGVMKELHQLGWKTELSFGDTGLFIFSGDKPANCH